MSLLPARMKIHSKLKALEWSQHFPIINIWGVFQPLKAGNSYIPGPICRISNPYEILRVSLLSARMKKILSKIKALERSQHYFTDAQGQLTPKSVTKSCRDSNSSKLLWLALLPAKMKKIHPKMKALELSQHFSHYKSRRSRAANS